MRHFVSSGPRKLPNVLGGLVFLSVLKERNYIVVYLVMVGGCFAVLCIIIFHAKIF